MNTYNFVSFVSSSMIADPSSSINCIHTALCLSRSVTNDNQTGDCRGKIKKINNSKLLLLQYMHVHKYQFWYIEAQFSYTMYMQHLLYLYMLSRRALALSLTSILGASYKERKLSRKS